MRKAISIAILLIAVAGIAEANTWKTAWTAFFYALVTFLIPFVFVFKNEILMMGTPLAIVVATGTLLTGTLFLVASVSGYLFLPISNWLVRVGLIAAAILTIVPETFTSVVGVTGGVLISGALFLKRRKAADAAGIHSGAGS